MEITIKQLERIFKYEDAPSNELADPNSNMSAEQVLDFYSGTYTKLTTAKIIGPTIEDGKEIYEFIESLGKLG